MFVFRVLGAVDLSGPDGRRIESVMSQPKRLALLALLALESPDRLHREEVMARLWPEMPEERARSALRQALHYLRRSFGPGVVVGSGAEGIGIAPGKLECDAAELLRAASEDRFEDALGLYQGDLLPGFHLDGAPVEFEHWLDDARRRLKRTAAEAARKLAEREEAAGNAVAAGVAGRKAWELGEWGEPALQELLRLLIRTGDLSGARDVYEEFAERLRREHGAEPSAATQEIVRSLDRPTGTTTAGAARVASPVHGDVGAELSSAAQIQAPASARSVSPWWVAAAAVLAVLLLAAGSLLPRQSEGVLEAAVGTQGPGSLYLEPVRGLELSGALSGMADAITTEIAGRLSETGGFRVIALSKGEEPAGGGGVRLRPTLRAVESEIQLSVLLLDASSDAVLDRVAVQVEEGRPATAEILSGRIVPQIRQGVGSFLSLRRLAGHGIDPEALEAVRKAADELEAANRLRSRGAGEAAALAYAATDSLLRFAAELAPAWPEPVVRRAEAARDAMWLHLIPPNDHRQLAHQEILRGLVHAEAALARHVNNVRARQVRGVLRYWAARTTPDADRKRAFEDEAERDLEQAVRQDPGLARAWSILSALAEKRGEYASAYHRARQAYVADYDLRVPVDILARLFTNALEVGDAEGAAEWCAEIRRRQPDEWLGPYCDLTHLAWVGPWTAAVSDSLLEEGLRKAGDGRRAELRTRLKLLHAVVLARAGEAAEAREVLASVDGAYGRSLDVLDLQAWVRTALGDTGRAQQLLAAAAELNPDVAPRVLRSRRYADLSSYALARSDQ